MKYLFIVFTGVFLLIGGALQAQQPTPRAEGAELDSLRKLEEASRDTVIFNSKYIRYTNIGLLKDRTQTLPIDTVMSRLQDYNVLNQRERPTINLGNLGLPYREMLFNPTKSIGFDPGFHSMDIYRLTQDSLKYYRARTPFTSLYYMNGTRAEQILRITHSQNIKPNWNVGGNYFRIGARGTYQNQNADHLNAAVFTWYESPNRRYNVFVNGLFNTMKAEENGSVLNDSVFTSVSKLGAAEETVRLGSSDPVRQTFKRKEFFLKQFYYIGRIDTVLKDSASRVLPTQRLSHSLNYSSDLYRFYKNDPDQYNVFPDIINDATRIIDSTKLTNLRNEFMYSFYLRPRSVSFLKNEIKLDLGIQHDLYRYRQMKGVNLNFQNVTLKGNAGYSFSDKASLNVGVQQIFQGRNAGDYLYEANAQFLLSRSVGRVVLGAYSQNKSPEALFERLNYTYDHWDNTTTRGFDKTKVNNLFFAYLNPKFGFNAKAEYFLMTNYLYLAETTFPNTIEPRQEGGNISMLKLSVSKRFRFGNFNLESFAVYEKTDYQDLLRVPEFYTYNSFWYGRKLVNNALIANLGIDARMNTTFTAPSYSINSSQFYNGYPVKYSSYPILDIWARFTLRRANVFIRYDYANKGLFNNGYYTVNRYPMPGTLLKYGVIWNFYD